MNPRVAGTRGMRPIRRATPRICIDFDGVVHAYTEGWRGGDIYDAPSEGTADALRELSKHYELVLLTARHDLDAVRKWLVEQHLSHYFVDVTNRKPAAAVYLDDRALKFDSWAQTLEALV